MRLLGKTVLLRIFGALAQFGLTLSVTRFTGAEAGLFFIGYSALQILAVVSRLGSELSAMREVAAAFHAAEPITLRDAILARVCIVMVTSITLAIGLAFFGKHLSSEVYFGYFVVSLPLLAMVGLLVEVLKAIDRADLGIFLLNVLVPLGGALGITFASLAGAADARSASLSILLSIALGLLIGMLALMHWFKRWKESSSEYVAYLSMVRRIMIILRDAPALLVVASTSVIMQWLGAVVLGLLGQPEAVAGYSVAMRLSIIVSIIHSAVTSLFAPRMAAAHTQSDVSLLRRLSHRTSLTVIALAMPALSALFFFAPFWLSLFGQEYTDYTVALRLLVTGQIVAAVIGHSGTVLVMAGAYNQARTTSLSAAVAILLLMVMLVPWGGPPGQHLPCRVPLLRGTSSQ